MSIVETVTCSQASVDTGEPLAGSATEAARWLLVEVRGAWGRDPLADTDLPPGVRERLAEMEGRVTFVRRPDRRAGAVVVDVRVDEEGGSARRLELPALADVAELDLDRDAEPVGAAFVLVCGHGRRDACCARLGRTAFDALAPHVAPDRLWQSSHLGGHRFAPNVVILPAGIQLGRVPVERASELAAAAAEGRIPLDLYRGRVLHPQHVQAAEIAVRKATRCDRVDAVHVLGDDGRRVTFATPVGERTAVVERRDGPVIPISCGVEPETTSVWHAAVETAA